MINRRLLLSILAGGCATVIPLRVGWTAPEPTQPRIPVVGIPRGTPVTSVILLGDHSPPRDFISTGYDLVPVESGEGEAIARERAVNLRSDGTLRHRQHHWPRN